MGVTGSDFAGGGGGMVDVSGSLAPVFVAVATSAGTHAGIRY